jgi:dipeptidyl aminopeptidase/acylaminoacyl peptidase
MRLQMGWLSWYTRLYALQSRFCRIGVRESMDSRIGWGFALSLTMFCTVHAQFLPAQPAPADYERALDLQKKYRGLVDHAPEEPVWLEGSDHFVYRRSTVASDGREPGYEYVWGDAESDTARLAFDHTKLAAALAQVFQMPIKPEMLPLGNFHFVDHESAIQLVHANVLWRCDLVSYACAKVRDLTHDDDDFDEGDSYDFTPQPLNGEAHAKISPDGKWLAWVENFNVVVRPREESTLKESAGKTPEAIRAAAALQNTMLSQDGSEGNYYAIDTLVWSPDSKHIAIYRIRPGYQRIVDYIESAPADQLQPKHSTMIYPKPGDVLPLYQPVLFDVAGHREQAIDNTLFPNPYELTSLVWWKDSRAFTFEYNQRGHQLYRVIEVNAGSGAPRVLIDEPSATFVNYEPLGRDQYDTGKHFRKDLADGKEIIWASERDGWEHLYLYDGHSGQVIRQITRGNWVVRAVDRVDEEKGEIDFEASGMNPGEDPYLVHGYKINFDGAGLAPLSPASDDHRLSYSSDGKYYLDIYSRIDQPPVMELHRTADATLVRTIETADISRLKAAGWQPPEPFHAPGRDGKTEIWGVIYRPHPFDPAKKYPVIEDIYAGPQGSFVPKSFTTRAQPLTELGFVVVQIDGMGTNNRSRAFHDVAWHNLKDAGFEDRILWHKAVAAKYPWYDISRVGIFGTSSGGQSSMGALLFHPEFYKVAVSNSGCHDNRMDKIWWNEQWMGWPIGPQYSESSNVDNAWRLKGKLMLVVGEMDHNVPPQSTYQVVDRLIKAGKDFDLLVVPGGEHGAGGRYGQRKLMDFFVRNLLDESTPQWNAQEESGKKEAPTGR